MRILLHPQPSAGVPQTRAASFGFGSSSATSGGQFCVCPGAHCVNTPQISPALQSALDAQAWAGMRAAFSAHASSDSSANAGQVLLAGGGLTGGLQAAAHSAEPWPNVLQSSVHFCIRSCICWSRKNGGGWHVSHFPLP